MDGVKAVQKWADSCGGLHDSETDAVQAQARIVVRNIIRDAIDWGHKTIDVEAIADRRTAFIDALRKIERGAL